MQPTYTAATTKAAFQLRYHFGWYCRGKKPHFRSLHITDLIDNSLREIAEVHDYHVLECDINPSVVRSLLSLRPNQSPSSVSRIVKGNLSKRLRDHFDQRNVWARSFFVRSVGHATGEVIRHYVAGQFAHHRVFSTGCLEAPDPSRFHACGDPSRLRTDAHSVFEYNVHIVLVVERRTEFLDFEVAKALIAYWRRTCSKYRWILWDIEVLQDHAHLFLGLRPVDDPERVVLSLMNNSNYFCQRRYAAAMRDANMSILWQPSFYVGTGGAATTAQVKAYLRASAPGQPSCLGGR